MRKPATISKHASRHPLLCQLDFGHSRGVAEGVGHGAGKVKRCFVRWLLRGDVTKACSRHSARRTTAMASVKVGRGLAYHAVAATRRRSRALIRVASRVTIENKASRHGVVRATALSDHWRYVSTPRCARTSWNVTSTLQRRTNQLTIRAGSRIGSVHSSA